jgi:hypothetical protein
VVQQTDDVRVVDSVEDLQLLPCLAYELLAAD